MARATDINRVLSLEVPLIVLLGERQMKVSEVVALIPGAIVELPKRSEEELQLLVNNKPIATGMAVKVGENYGLRVTFVGDLKSRIAALGAGTGGFGPVSNVGVGRDAGTGAGGVADDLAASGAPAAAGA